MSESSIKQALSLASCALLSQTATAETKDHLWQLDAALLVYAEDGDRTETFEPIVSAKKELSNGDKLNLKFVLDVITGASPTGAMPSSRVQTFTRPSGTGRYNIAPGVIPVDDTFQDNRLEVAVDWETSINDKLRAIYGGSFSIEYDFSTLSARTTLARDLNQKNTTLSAGLAFESSEIDPEGGVPIELASAMIPAGQPQNRRASQEDRQQVELLLGWTQVLNRRTIMQLNLGHSRSSGYHTDPFKFITLIDVTNPANLGEPLDNIFENRPDKRSKSNIFWQLKRHLTQDIVGFSYRLMDDDWGITSHTIDLRYTFMPRNTSRHQWQPHFRWYQQSAADFYRTNIRNDEVTPQLLSADYRLGELSSYTLGMKYTRHRKNGKPFEVRFEYMQQDNTASRGSQIGFLSGREIIDDTRAIILQFNYLL